VRVLLVITRVVDLKLFPVCCVTNRTPDVDNSEIFGFGIHIDLHTKKKDPKTPAEIICVGAFDGGRRVKSTQNLDISFILPLWINERHWTAAKPKLFEQCRAMWKLNADFQQLREPSAEIVVLRVLCRVLTCMVADEKCAGVLTGCGGETSECFVSGVFSVLRLLKQLAVEHPAMVEYADATLHRFVNELDSRSKTICPNIGDLLPLLCVSSQGYDWNFVKNAYVEESNIRSVMWCAAAAPVLCSFLTIFKVSAITPEAEVAEAER
jgi:hypothetical protein